MRIQNLCLMLIGLLGCSFAGHAQSFQSTFFYPGIDYNHYSIQVTNTGEYVCAGTLFNGALTDIHIFKTDAAGNMLWERIIDQSDDDRGLDVMIDPKGDIVVVGYTSPLGPNEPEFYIVKLNQSGGYIADKSLKQFPASVATNIIYSQARQSYIVGGFYSDPLAFPIISNEALLVEFDQNIKYINHTQISSFVTENTSINDIVEIPGGYFVTGSIGMSGGGTQACLAMTLNHGLKMLTDLSFESTNSEHVGVSAVYNSTIDQLFVMSNNSYLHNPQITVIVDVSVSPNISHHYYLALDPTLSAANAAGFQLKQCLWDPNSLIACGYFKTFSDNITSNNAIPWIVQFDAFTGQEAAAFYWPASSPNFHSHGGGVLSTFSGEHPYIFNQEILTERADGQGYVLVGPRAVSGNFGIDLVTTNFMNETPCFKVFHYNHYTVNSVPVKAGTNFKSVLTSPPYASLMTFTSDYTNYCESLGERLPNFVDDSHLLKDANITGTTARINQGEMNVTDIQVSPNPFTDAFVFEISGENLSGQIIVTNAVGQNVYSSNVTSGDYYRGEINLAGYERGIYILKFMNGEQEIIEKIVKI